MKNLTKYQGWAVAAYALFLILFLVFTSCDKIGVCASCQEMKSGIWADDYCATPQEVHVYVRTLEQDNYGMDWECTIH